MIKFTIKKRYLENLRRKIGFLFILIFQLLLFCSGLLLIQNKTELAEYVGNYAYYSLVIGVIIIVIDRFSNR